jgi:hypothetical protein
MNDIINGGVSIGWDTHCILVSRFLLLGFPVQKIPTGLPRCSNWDVWPKLCVSMRALRMIRHQEGNGGGLKLEHVVSKGDVSSVATDTPSPRFLPLMV